jgi:hypothetical protein
VTATSSNHFKPLLYFVRQLRLFEPDVRLIVYDIGLNACQRDLVGNNTDISDVRIFNFSKYPPHFDLHVAFGEYAWKPAIMREVLADFSSVLWLDSGDYIVSKMDTIWSKLKKHGFYTSPSAGRVSDWAHPGMRSKLGVGSRFNSKKNCNGAVVGIVRDTAAFSEIFLPWYQCALQKDCIAPAGSSRKNHRQDQAALTLLVYRSELSTRCFCDGTCVDFDERHPHIVDGIGQWSDQIAETSIKSSCDPPPPILGLHSFTSSEMSLSLKQAIMRGEMELG